ncbi:Hsp20/alpha crystallin family protein [Thermobrachium celere]|uniref:Small heat shock protein n=1 Tax=Thermobrachium celere DSM 8682 TaxID=941824 RepID=R7RUV9_9CLOT|nr:Hsp20/alpha crystallin family protein [Thermobrachium celere]GFR34655.1 heat-shock protein Hsp20 [Thermobrachium celere]CDF59356.1 Small heat shock protein [Thermobrachium celere DSM 8682]
MYLKPIEPFREFDRLRRQLDSLFSYEEFERPRIDVIETEKEVKVKAEIPGISKDDLDIVVYDEEVRISGEFKKSDEYKDENLRRVERYYGSFSRVVPLPSEVKSEEAKADYKDGILTITIPKADVQSSRGKRIKLQ